MQKNIEEQFRNVIIAYGFNPPSEIIVDGKKHRCSTNDNKRDLAGEYCIYPDKIPAGYFKDHRTETYVSWRLNIGRTYTQEENLEYEEAVKKRKEIEKNEQKDAAIKSRNILRSSIPSNDDHLYLVSKGIPHLWLRTYKGNLIMPVTLDGVIHSLQFIKPDGDKFFISNGRVNGCYYPIGKPGKIICICEGFATAASLYQATNYSIVVAFCCGNLLPVAQHIRNKFSDALIVLCADNDVAGLKYAKNAADLVNGRVAIPVFDDKKPEKATDFNDMASLYGLDQVKKVIELACEPTSVANLKASSQQPLPLPENPLPNVMPFNPEDMLPPNIRAFVIDVAMRQQSPIDFVATTVLCTLAAALGNKVKIYPKQKDNWVVTPNLWGANIGDPSAMKSPTMKAALKPLRELEGKFYDNFLKEEQKYVAELQLNKLQQKVNEKKAKDKIENSDAQSDILSELTKNISQISLPVRQRLIVNDATVEMLGVLLKENPHGLILVRDELSGWLSNMQREDYQADRAFYLECFDGDSKYTYDRVGRGTIEIPNCTLSIIGGIQPSKIVPVIRKATSGVSDDGLVQRLQLAVWPDENQHWSWMDQAPDSRSYERYQQAFLNLYNINCGDTPEFLHFTIEAQALFIEWMEEIQIMARKEISPVFASHLLKMPKTIASLALIFELVIGGKGAVGIDAIAMALEWSDYLISHAKKIYSLGLSQGITGAHMLLDRKDKLLEPFSARMIYRKGWSVLHLNSPSAAKEAIQCLIDYNYLRAEELDEKDVYGKKTIVFKWIN